MQSRKKCSVESSLGDSASITLHSLTATVNTTLIVGTWNTHARQSQSQCQPDQIQNRSARAIITLLRILNLALGYLGYFT